MNIYFLHNRLLVAGEDFSRSYHRHYFYQIMISPQAPFQARLKDGTEKEGHIMLINSNVEHRCLIGSPSLSLFIDPEGPTGDLFIQLIPEGSLQTAPLDILGTTLKGIQAFLTEKEHRCADAAALSNRIVESFFPGQIKNSRADARITALLDYIPSVPDKKIQVSELARIAGLSESRLMHLFGETMGISIRRYLLWKRLLDGLLLIDKGESMTMAALEAGFSDYAHFSRTFKENFGTSLKSIFRNSRFVHVSFCHS
ncbi:MAG: helix-turn-helix transcriptional regulator [Spirochaetales bacterium]|nr:helix-turn-helix transcriptional regulator [Spirochaetales bacterium]